MTGLFVLLYAPKYLHRRHVGILTQLYVEKSNIRRGVHCIKSKLYLAKRKWILRSGPKLKMLVKFHCFNSSFPNLLNWWRIRFCCTALDQCYWNKENWFANWKSTMHFSPPPNIKKINSSEHTGRFDLWSSDYKAGPLTTGPLQLWYNEWAGETKY